MDKMTTNKCAASAFGRRTASKITQHARRRIQTRTASTSGSAQPNHEWFVSDVQASSGKKVKYRLEYGRLKHLETDEQRGPSRLKEKTLSLIERTLYPEGEVTKDYWGFAYWNFLRSAISSSTSVLGTQGLLRALGLNANTAIASSAAVNWVLKDGLGRIGCILAASVIGNKFDNDAKLYNFCGDVLYELGILLEILSPTCAHLFLLVASLANAFKSMSYMSRLPARAAILRSFASIRENVGDVSAKANSQDVVSGLLGLLLGIQISFFVGTSLWKTLAVYAISASAVAYTSLKSLSGLELRTLNFHRLEILLDHFVQHNDMLSPKEVNRREHVFSSFSGLLKREDFSVIFGANLKHFEDEYEDFEEILKVYQNEEFMISLKHNKKRNRLDALLYVQSNISTESTIKAMLNIAELKHR